MALPTLLRDPSEGGAEKDREYVEDLLDWDSQRRCRDMSLCNLMLVVGGLVTVAAAVYTILDFTDRAILGVLVPGFAIGLLLIGGYLLLSLRVRERARFARIVRELRERARGLRTPS